MESVLNLTCHFCSAPGMRGQRLLTPHALQSKAEKWQVEEPFSCGCGPVCPKKKRYPTWTSKCKLELKPAITSFDLRDPKLVASSNPSGFSLLAAMPAEDRVVCINAAALGADLKADDGAFGLQDMEGHAEQAKTNRGRSVRRTKCPLRRPHSILIVAHAVCEK